MEGQECVNGGTGAVCGVGIMLRLVRVMMSAGCYGTGHALTVEGFTNGGHLYLLPNVGFGVGST
jgi:hypothetical protein